MKVLLDMGLPISKEVQLISFHTVSKGYWGECGQRGGYFEMTNIPPEVCISIHREMVFVHFLIVGDFRYLRYFFSHF